MMKKTGPSHAVGYKSSKKLAVESHVITPAVLPENVMPTKSTLEFTSTKIPGPLFAVKTPDLAPFKALQAKYKKIATRH